MMCTYIAAYRIGQALLGASEVLGSSTPPCCNICYIFLSYPTIGSCHCHFSNSNYTATLSHSHHFPIPMHYGLEATPLYPRGDPPGSHLTLQALKEARYPPNKQLQARGTRHASCAMSPRRELASHNKIPYKRYGVHSCSGVDAAAYWDPIQGSWIDQTDNTPVTQSVLTTILNWLQEHQDLDYQGVYHPLVKFENNNWVPKYAAYPSESHRTLRSMPELSSHEVSRLQHHRDLFWSHFRIPHVVQHKLHNKSHSLTYLWLSEMGPSPILFGDLYTVIFFEVLEDLIKQEITAQ